MAGTRSSNQKSDSPKSSPNGKRKASAGNSPQAKRARQDVTGSKKQKSLDETMNGPSDEDLAKAAQKAEEIQANGSGHAKNDSKDEKMADDKSETNDVEMADNKLDDKSDDNADAVAEAKSEAKAEAKAELKAEAKAELKAEAETKADAKKEQDSTDDTSSPTQDNNGTTKSSATTKMDSTGEVSQHKDNPSTGDATGAVEVSTERKESTPSNILEKGIIYFFTRARVGIDQPEGAGDLARTYMVLRPLPHGASLSDGTIEDKENCRLLALPKKVLPKSHQDVFMSFVEKTGASVAQLKDEFMKGSDYSTKTTGTRHTQAVTPIGEGIYALTSTGKATHLAYMLTIPAELGEVQEEMGLASKGSFVVSAKNPTQRGPANASLAQSPDFPKE